MKKVRIAAKNHVLKYHNPAGESWLSAYKEPFHYAGKSTKCAEKGEEQYSVADFKDEEGKKIRRNEAKGRRRKLAVQWASFLHSR